MNSAHSELIRCASAGGASFRAREVQDVVAEQSVDAERQGGRRRQHRAGRGRAGRQPARSPMPPMAKAMAVVWNGGIGPDSTVRLASVAHSRMAPTPSAVAVLERHALLPSPDESASAALRGMERKP